MLLSSLGKASHKQRVHTNLVAPIGQAGVFVVTKFHTSLDFGVDTAHPLQLVVIVATKQQYEPDLGNGAEMTSLISHLATKSIKVP